MDEVTKGEFARETWERDVVSSESVETVKFLHYNRTEGCTMAAMDGAAGNEKVPRALYELHKLPQKHKRNKKAVDFITVMNAFYYPRGQRKTPLSLFSTYCVPSPSAFAFVIAVSIKEGMLARFQSTSSSENGSDFSLSAGLLMAKEASPSSQQQLYKHQTRRRHSISTTVVYRSATTSAALVSNASMSTAAFLSTTAALEASAASRGAASVTGLVSPMPRRMPSSKVSGPANTAPSANVVSPNKCSSQRRAKMISSTQSSISRSRINVLPVSGHTDDAPSCPLSSSSSVSSSRLSSSSPPVQALKQQQSSLRITREAGRHQELPILRCQYVARDVKVLIGTRWKLKKFETRTVVLCANGSATPVLTTCAQMPIGSDPSAVNLNLALDLTCTHSGSNGLKLKSSSLRLKIRFTTSADAAIWFKIIHDTMSHARWIQGVEETVCLSRDATATVLVARHVPTDKEFVIKVLPKVRVDDGACMEILVLKKLFRAVATVAESSSSSMAALTHILEYHVVETLKDVRLIMPKLPGMNLLQFLQQTSTDQHQHKHSRPHHRLSESDARSVLLGLCESLQALHAIGIVHCDLKLENILLTDVTNVRVIDFGGAYELTSTDSNPMLKHRITLSLSQQQHRRRMVGTPGYIAPERIFFVDEPPTSAADVFSVGIVLFQMLTGRQPFIRSSRHRALSMQDATVLNWNSAEKMLSSHGVSPLATQLIERMVEQDSRSRITVGEVFCHPWLCC